MEASTKTKLIRFLNEQLAVSTDELKIAVRQSDATYGNLPMVLWQYGLISLSQLEQIFDWWD